jgi:hypothetical protein
MTSLLFCLPHYQIQVVSSVVNFSGILFADFRQELEIDHYIEFGNIHRFGRRGTNNARPIAARFIYDNDLQMVLQNAYKLKGSSFGISEQYPAEINNRRKNLYPIMREAKQQRRHVVLVRDRLFIDGEQYIPPEDRPVNLVYL